MTYEYACSSCGHEWEAEQSINDPPLKKCPACKKNSAKRQISGGTGFVLKGGGWYADRYGAPSAKASEKSESKSEADTSTKDSKKASGDSKSVDSKSSDGKSSDKTSGKSGSGAGKAAGTKAAE